MVGSIFRPDASFPAFPDFARLPLPAAVVR